jgi:translation initiation factor 2 beta subunit (eIF-2beta)/eIF-5
MEPVFDPSKLKNKKSKSKKSIPTPSADDQYIQLLDKAFEGIDDNQKVVRLKLPFPIVGKIGGKRTHVENFVIICQCLGRDPSHVRLFFNAELCTDSSLDAKGGIVIKGIFQPVKIKKILSNYIAEYITCRVCGAQDTELKKIERVNYVICKCGARRSVVNLKP